MQSKIIISLTSFPERMNILPIALNSLFEQSINPDKIVLWLAPEQFPNKKVPDSILNFQEKGLDICWYHDIKSYKKLIPALLKFPGDIIITADDDITYRKMWLEELINSYNRNPEYIHAHRVRRIQVSTSNELLPYNQWPIQLTNLIPEPSFMNFATSGGGVLYPPNCFDSEIFNEENFTKLAPFADDIWFWAMSLKNNIKTKIVGLEHSKIIEIENNTPKLWNKNIRPDGNDKQLKCVLDHYNLWDKIISSKFNSVDYWENRYAANGNSGSGSYNRLAQFKADILNDFCNKQNIETVIEFGSGDGNNLSLYKIRNYIGFDVSHTILNKLKDKFKKDKTKNFFHISKFNNQKAELSISFDVIFHLIENEVFREYMENLFNSAEKYVIIYSSNKDENHTNHVKHREFTKWIYKYKKDWKLKEVIKNKYPYAEKDPHNTSFSDFYIFEK